MALRRALPGVVASAFVRERALADAEAVTARENAIRQAIRAGARLDEARRTQRHHDLQSADSARGAKGSPRPPPASGPGELQHRERDHPDRGEEDRELGEGRATLASGAGRAKGGSQGAARQGGHGTGTRWHRRGCGARRSVRRRTPRRGA
jgi:hypothetical protein